MSADTRVHVEKQKPRYLDDTDLKAFLATLPGTQIRDSIKDLLLLQLLTASRKGEVCEMEWSEVDLDEGVWTLPGSKAKNKQQHRVMLSDQAQKIIEAQPRINEFVFATKKTLGHIRGDTVNEALSRRIGDFKIKPFTPHALRHTALTGLSRLGCNREIQNRISNHKDSTIGGLYDQNPRDDEAREWLQKWADHLDSLTEDNVIPMGERRG